MAKIRIYSELSTNNIHFEGSRVSVKEIGSLVTLIAWRITTEIKFAVNSPNKINAGMIMYKFEVSMLENKIVAPIVGK